MLKLSQMVLDPEPPTQVRNALLNTEQWIQKTAFPALTTPSAQIEYFNRLGAYIAQQIAHFEGGTAGANAARQGAGSSAR
jgi:hypothetical protein